MSSSRRDEHIANAREIDRMSTVLIDFGYNFVKRNPIPTVLYFIGILICLIFNGFATSDLQRSQYIEALQKIDHNTIDNANYEFYNAEQNYFRSRGWFFTCDTRCQELKYIMTEAALTLKEELRKEQNAIGEAKSLVGLFSNFGILETRELFWTRFSQGKKICTTSNEMGCNIHGHWCNRSR